MPLGMNEERVVIYLYNRQNKTDLQLKPELRKYRGGGIPVSIIIANNKSLRSCNILFLLFKYLKTITSLILGKEKEGHVIKRRMRERERERGREK